MKLKTDKEREKELKCLLKEHPENPLRAYFIETMGKKMFNEWLNGE